MGPGKKNSGARRSVPRWVRRGDDEGNSLNHNLSYGPPRDTGMPWGVPGGRGAPGTMGNPRACLAIC